MSGGIARRAARRGCRFAVQFLTSHWSPYSRLIPVSDSSVWVINREMKEVSRLARQSGIKTGHPKVALYGGKQSVFVGSHFDILLNDFWFQTDHRLATAYFHGKPGQGVEEFDRCFEVLSKRHREVERIQVSCQAMRNLILETGIDINKIHLIPIAINLTYFKAQTRESRLTTRKNLEIPHDAFIVGSFQKDGNGWGEGLEPKLIKGPDVFLKTVEILKQSIPELYILLSGPARGYVKSGLNRLKIPYKHVYQKSYSDIGRMFQALDLYIVASREEGGPKAVLESMASGVPLVTTCVGQAMDLVKHGQNGWIVSPDDHEGLAYWSKYAFEHTESIRSVIQAARETVKKIRIHHRFPCGVIL